MVFHSFIGMKNQSPLLNKMIQTIFLLYEYETIREYEIEFRIEKHTKMELLNFLLVFSFTICSRDFWLSKCFQRNIQAVQA